MFSLLDKLGEARMAGGRAVVLEEEGDEYEEWEEEEEEEDEWAEGKYEDEEEEEDEDDFEWEEEDDDEEDGPPLGLAAQQAKDQQDAERLIAMLGGLEVGGAFVRTYIHGKEALLPSVSQSV